MYLTIIRGLPGSGKTTLAHKMSQETGTMIIESDMLRVRNEEYIFTSEETGRVHQATRWLLRTMAKQGADVILTGCFAKKRVVDNFIAIAKLFCNAPVEVRIIHCVDEGYSPHNVPDEVIQEMADAFEGIKGEEEYSHYDYE